MKNKGLYISLVFILIFSRSLMKTNHKWTNNQIASAIYKAENSTKYPYGIEKRYKHTTPRQVCIKTINHARRDYKRGDFIEFLGSRYCPYDTKNWARNVKYFLNASK